MYRKCDDFFYLVEVESKPEHNLVEQKTWRRYLSYPGLDWLPKGASGVIIERRQI